MQPVPQVGVVQSFACATRGTVTADTITNSHQHHRRAVCAQRPRGVRSQPRPPPAAGEHQGEDRPRRSHDARGSRPPLRPRHEAAVLQRHHPATRLARQAAQRPGPDPARRQHVSAIANATARIPGAALQLVYSTAMGNYDFTTFLEALQSNTLLDVQAEPQCERLEQPHGEPHGRHAGTDPRDRRRRRAAAGRATSRARPCRCSRRV